MIKVIERGTKTIGECENCGCRFSYEKEDIKKDKLYARGELKAVISYVDCPHCGIAHKLTPKK